MAGSGVAQLRDDDDIVLSVENLVMEFSVGRNEIVHAVSDVSFDVKKGETLGIVGESGCGKSTTARSIVQLPKPTSGSVMVTSEGDSIELTGLKGDALRKVRPKLQMIFQDPISSLNPRRIVREVVKEGLTIWPKGMSAQQIQERVDEVLESVGIDPEIAANRRAHEFSGGQRQRICVARALALEPEFIVCDEAVSAMDVSVQAQVLNLLKELQTRRALTYIFISHDLSVVKFMADTMAVMRAGIIVEQGVSEEIYSNPKADYTKHLIEAIPCDSVESIRKRVT